jgi:hypothetical protein
LLILDGFPDKKITVFERFKIYFLAIYANLNKGMNDQEADGRFQKGRDKHKCGTILFLINFVTQNRNI